MRDNVAKLDNQEWANTSRVPVAQILDSRAAFPSQQLSFDILLESDEPWHGLELCAQLTRKGLLVRNIVYRNPGRILLQFQDDRSITAQELARLFDSSSQVCVSRWTTVLGGTA